MRSTATVFLISTSFFEIAKKLDRTISNKQQRLQSMLRWSGVDPQIFPPKPRYEKKLPTIYTPTQLAGLFGVATPY